MADLGKCCITAGDVGAAGAKAVSCSFGGKREGQPAKEKRLLLGCNLSFQAAGIFLCSLTQPKESACDQTAFVLVKLSEAEKDGRCAPFLPCPGSAKSGATLRDTAGLVGGETSPAAAVGSHLSVQVCVWMDRQRNPSPGEKNESRIGVTVVILCSNDAPVLLDLPQPFPHSLFVCLQ